jgi:hypothetical protein
MNWRLETVDSICTRLSQLVIILIIFFSLCSTPKAAATTFLSVDPPLTSTAIYESFTVNITISDVTSLGGWEFKLIYRNDIVSAQSYAEGLFLKQGGSTTLFPIEFDDSGYNETHGLIWLTCVIIGGGSGVNGSGVLAELSFGAIGGGSTRLHLIDTVLGDPQANPIAHSPQDGDVEVAGLADIAVTNVLPSRTFIGEGYLMDINVTVENQGFDTESFNVTAYANETIIDTILGVTLPSGNSTMLTFAWSTNGFNGNYSISAYAHPLPGEVDLNDNTYTDGEVTVRWPYDVNQDNYVGIDDIVLVAEHFGEAPIDPNWNPIYDLNGDDYVGIDDIVLVAEHFGETPP